MNGIRRRNALASHKGRRRVLDTTTGRVRLGKISFRETLQYEGKILYYEDKQLVERTPEEVQEELDKKGFQALLMTLSATALLLRVGWICSAKRNAGRLKDIRSRSQRRTC